jgi:hypothetical protein
MIYFSYFAYFCFFLAPGLALSLGYKKKWKLQNQEIFIVSVVFSMLVSYFAFWIFYFKTSGGILFCWLTYLVSYIYIFYYFSKIKGTALFRNLAYQLLLLFFAYLVYINILQSVPLDIRFRFTPELPHDNLLPLQLAFCVFKENALIKECFKGVELWQSSDRPPLFSGMLLFIFPLRVTEIFESTMISEFHQNTGLILQLTWVNVVYYFLRVFNFSKTTIRFIILSFLLSGIFLINTLYLWPKIITLIPYIYALSIFLNPQKRKNISKLLISFMALALAYLLHGGIIFSILPLFLLFGYEVVLKTKLSFSKVKRIVFGFIVFISLIYPWTLYQKLYDPPGDNLIKMRIAGQRELDGEELFPNHPYLKKGQSVFKAIQESYSSVPLDVILYTKISNVETFFYFESPKWKTINFYDFNYWIRSKQFFFTFMSLGFLVIGFPLLLLRYRKLHHCQKNMIHDFSFIFILSNLFWILAMFEPEATIIHQGSYANLFFIFTLSSLGFSYLKRVRWIFLFGNFILFLFWIPDPNFNLSNIDFQKLIYAAISLLILIRLLIKRI